MTLEEFYEFANNKIRKNQEAKRQEAERAKRMMEYLTNWVNRPQDRYEIRQNRGHYEVFHNGEFYCSADTHAEAMAEIPE